MLEDKQDGSDISKKELEQEKGRVLKFRDQWLEVVKRRKELEEEEKTCKQTYSGYNMEYQTQDRALTKLSFTIQQLKQKRTTLKYEMEELRTDISAKQRKYTSYEMQSTKIKKDIEELDETLKLRKEE